MTVSQPQGDSGILNLGPREHEEVIHEWSEHTLVVNPAVRKGDEPRAEQRCHRSDSVLLVPLVAPAFASPNRVRHHEARA